jgi:hypothetical protein
MRGDVRPVVAGCASTARGEGKGRNAGLATASLAFCEIRAAKGWVASIKQIEFAIDAGTRKAIRSAEAADAGGHRLKRRFFGSSSQRQQTSYRGWPASPGQRACLGGAAKHQNADLAHA